MTPFLQQIASLFYRRYGTTIHRLAFVFPNQRSGLFFRKYLAQQAQQPLFSPTILTISELFWRLSDKQPADRIRMLFLLYKIYIRHCHSDESFDDFVYWGDMLLNDFNDIDKHLADASRLFTNLTDIHQIDRDFSYLQPEKLEAIRTFWSSFQPNNPGENRENFLDTWKHLFAIYTAFKQALAAEGIAYEGMICREVVEKMQTDDGMINTAGQVLSFEKIVFVGLNALSTAEKELMKGLQKQGMADFYWDCGSQCLLDVENKASYFVRDYVQQFPSAYPLLRESSPEEEQSRPEIELIGIPSRIGQAKQVYSILKESLAGKAVPDPEEAIRTAIVLPDEQLLIPVLHSIPEEFTHINVTLGYPLSGTPIASLMESVFDLQKRVRLINGRPFFYHREVLAILNHQYVSATCPDEIDVLIKEITTHNKLFIATDDLNRSPLLGLIFQGVDSELLSDYLLRILKELNRLITLRNGGEPQNDEDDAINPNRVQNPVRVGELEQEFVYHYFTMVNRLKEMILPSEISMSAETFFRLLKRLTGTITIPFQGKPLSGIQVMGVLETRVLDFDRLIILSMNEGIFPAKTTAGSFIPYNLRKGFGLPVFEHQDSIWSYHFYRLIARANKVTLLYDTRTEGLQTGEVSRFVQQLRYQYGVPVNDKFVVSTLSSTQPIALQIDKTTEVMSKMTTFLKGGGKALSASTVNTFLDCPLKFYFTVIEGLKEDEEEVSERVDNKVFGTIFHRVAEWLYQPFHGSEVTAGNLKLRVKEPLLTEAIHHAFSAEFFHSKEVQSLSGQYYLTGEMIRKYVLKLVEKDCELTPFRYIHSEQKIQHPFRLTNGKEIQLKGFIDRLDEVDGRIRVVDYKTGSKKGLDFKSMESLFDTSEEKRQSAIMQVFMYAWIHNQTHTTQPIQPTLYYVRDFFSSTFNPVIKQGKEKVPVYDFAVISAEFEDCLRTNLDTLFNPAIPFAQTPNTKICHFCPFAGVCGR